MTDRVERRIQIWLWIFVAFAVVAYCVDFAQHGISACWRLLWLFLLARNLAGFQFGVDLDAMERRGTEEYLNKIYDAPTVQLRLRHRDERKTCLSVMIVAAAEVSTIVFIDYHMLGRATIALPLGVMILSAALWVLFMAFAFTTVERSPK